MPPRVDARGRRTVRTPLIHSNIKKCGPDRLISRTTVNRLSVHATNAEWVSSGSSQRLLNPLAAAT